MKRILFLFALISLILVQSLQAKIPPEPSGIRLRQIVADKFPHGNVLIGGTTGQHMFATPTAVIMDREFSYVTPENDFKQPQIHPDNSTWQWAKPDAWVDRIAKNSQVLRMHGPIGPQASTWAKDDRRIAAELEQNMREFMQELCKRFSQVPGIISLDVVNETIINGRWNKDKPGTSKWECPWFRIGQDNDEDRTPLYIKYAFEEATKYGGNLKLIYNHHEKVLIPASWNLIKKTVISLRDNGLRVDGIGWQSHIAAGWELIPGQTDELRELIDWAHQNNLEFHITEQTVGIDNTSKSELEKQAATYREIIEILLEKSSGGTVGWNTWQIDDANGCCGEDFVAPFDIEYVAKPAYYAIQEALERTP